MVYNDKVLYKFDPNATDKPEPIAKLKGIKDEKTLSGIELFDWGIALTGQSDVIGVNSDGTTLYHNTYTEPGGTGRKFAKFGAGMLGVASGVATTSKIVYTVRDKDGNVREQSTNLFNNNTRAAGDVAGGIASVIMAKNSKRFNALKENSQFAYVINKGAEGPELVKVQKSDGKELDKVLLDNNKPIYDVDPATGKIFYVYKNELRIFN
jgi:hypothetical protein